MDLSRRFFLGGAISLVAVATFKPSVNAIGNMPTIYGDGKYDDASGLGALFRKEPVIFNKEMIGVDSHNGITFHHGTFIINNSVHIPENTILSIRRATFFGEKLPDNFPFFICEDDSGHQFSEPPYGLGVHCIFEVNKTHKSKFIDYKHLNSYEKNRRGWV